MSSKAVRPVLVALVSLVVAVAAFVFVTGRPLPWPPPAQDQPRQPTALPLQGVVQAPARWELRAVAAGTVVALGASENLPVAGGQLIAQIDSAEAKAGLQAARQRLQNLQTNASPARTSPVQTKLDRAQADLQSAQEKTKQLQAQLAAYTKQQPTAAAALDQAKEAKATMRAALADRARIAASLATARKKAGPAGQADSNLTGLQAELSRAEQGIWQAQNLLSQARNTGMRLREDIARLVRLQRSLESSQRSERLCRERLQTLTQSPAAQAAARGDQRAATAQAQVAEAERLVAACAVTAPGLGRLVELRVRPGMKVKAGQAVAVVEEEGGPRLVFTAPAEQTAGLTVGRRAQVTLTNPASRRSFSAAISQIVPGQDRAQVYLQPLGKASLPPVGTALTARLR